MVRNGQPSTAAQKLSIEFLRECFEYRDGVLYWRQRPASHFQREADHATFIKKSAGKRAGRREPKGYVCVKFRNGGHPVCISVHRIVWAMHYGAWPTLHIDHINRVRDDNRIENLREVTPAENNKNSARNRVFPYVGPHKWGGFQAQVKLGTNSVHIGVFDTEEDANSHRLFVLDELAKLANSLAKKSNTGRRRKDGKTFPGQTPLVSGDSEANKEKG